MASRFQNRGRALEILGLFPVWNITPEDGRQIIEEMGKLLESGEIPWALTKVGEGLTVPQLDHIHAGTGKTLEQVARESKKNAKLKH
jgi:hypothetical protein